MRLALYGVSFRHLDTHPYATIEGLSQVMRMPLTRVFKVGERVDEDVVDYVSRVLGSGGLAVLPTETVYGVAASLWIESAIERLFVAKSRPREPLTIHFARVQDVEDLVSDPEPLYRLWGRLWPGPLTIIVKASPTVPRVAIAGLPCVGLRAPAHPLTSAVLDRVGPCVMPSANISGRPSPRNGFEALVEMFGRVDVAVDAGPCPEGLESTVVDLCSSPPRVLRLGPLGLREVEAALGRPLEVSKRALGIDRRARYRISKPLVLVDGDPDDPSYTDRVAKYVRELVSRGAKVAILCRSDREELYRSLGAIPIAIGRNELEAARHLFDALRIAERAPIDIVVAESWGSKGLGLAVTSRLRNAAEKIV